MKNTLRILTCFLGILAGCTNLSHTPPQIEEKTVAIYTKNAIAISELETSVIASGLSFTLLPIDGPTISPSPIDHDDTVMNFLFVDYTTKEIGIHFVDLMPDEQNIEREKHMDSMGIPFENIYPPLKTLHITNEYRAKFPEYYYLPDVPDYAKFYKEKYLQDRIGKDYIPFYYQPLVEADFESFILWTGWIYASDKNNVYILLRYDVPMIDREIANYKLFEKEGSIQYPFYTTISGASAEEGNWVSNPFYLVQSRGVWYKGIPVEGADPFDEILFLGTGYFVQPGGVWFEYKKIPEADPQTFRVLEDNYHFGYAVDRDSFYINTPYNNMPYFYYGKPHQTKEDILKSGERNRCIYRQLFQQIKDDPVYSHNVLVELMKSPDYLSRSEGCIVDN